ncbi:MAG: metallophosphoesterase [Cyclobacteriaceae bacterium]|nr:metallophosphoesterase [Cyclobacteriaceae bacterium]
MNLFYFRIKSLTGIILILFLFANCSKRLESEQNFSFVFMTDIHVQPEKQAMEGFQMAIDKANALKPDFVITGGDLIMDALGQTEARADSLYDIYTNLTKKFAMPVYNTMGNHEMFGIIERSGVSSDHPLYGKKIFEQKIGKKYDAFTYKGWRFYILNSVDTTADRNYYGHIDDEQIEWLKKDLSQVDKNTPICISVHIPFYTIQTQIITGPLAPNTKGGVITNGNEVLGLFENHNLKLVLQGHLHFVEDLYANGVHFITGGAVCAGWWDGPRNGMEEGFMQIDVQGDQFTWEYIDYGWEVKQTD